MTESPADTIRRAARLMRQRAQAAHGGHWECVELPPNQHAPHTAWWVNTTIHDDGEGEGEGGTVHLTVADVIWQRADAEHIAGMHPGVATAAADLFDAIATEAEAALVFTGIDPRAVESAPVWAAAIKAARAYLGETPDAAYVTGIIERSARLDQ